MKRVAPFILAILFLTCKDPFGFKPEDPTKIDPPDPPVQTCPPDGKLIKNYAYPQDVVFKWQPVAGTESYQVQVYTDSIPSAQTLLLEKVEITAGETTITFGRFGFYFWRVRASSRRWKLSYTDWSSLSKFILPNPTD